MSLIREIQKGLLDSSVDLSTILLKLRFLASRLGSEPLEDWVKHEAGGYPPDVDVPSYREVSVSYRGTWSGGWGTSIENAPIPSYLIEKHAGEGWTKFRIRESIAAVESLASQDDGTIGIDASNLILLLQGKVYEDMACNSVTGQISSVSVREIKNTVQNRILDLTLEIEKRFPEALEVSPDQAPPAAIAKTAVTQIFNQTVYGNVAHILAADGGTVNFSFEQGDRPGMVAQLIEAGVPEHAADEFGAIISSEKPESAEEPLGEKARAWLRTAAGAAGSGAWKIGTQALTALATEAALRFYGLK